MVRVAFDRELAPWPEHPVARALAEYFAGRVGALSGVPVAVEGLSGAEVLLWLRREVGPGRTITYGQLAREFSTSPRAVGRIMARNPVPLLVPCHRVVARDGLGGYSADPWRKEWLLRHERENSHEES